MVRARVYIYWSAVELFSKFKKVVFFFHACKIKPKMTRFVFEIFGPFMSLFLNEIYSNSALSWLHFFNFTLSPKFYTMCEYCSLLFLKYLSFSSKYFSIWNLKLKLCNALEYCSFMFLFRFILYIYIYTRQKMTVNLILRVFY